MPLSPEQINALLEKDRTKSAPKAKSRSGRTIDTSNRDILTWFALAHKMLDDTATAGPDQEAVLARCANPDCQDPRNNKYQLIAKVNGQSMCRYCFIEGWLK